MFRRYRRLLFILLVLPAILAVILAVRIVSFPSTVTSGNYDCAIVLGAAVHSSDPSPVFRSRIDHAIELYQKGIVKSIIFTGGFGNHEAEAESAVARQYALKLGVPASAILTEERSRTTHENLLEARQLMASHSLNSALIVSDPYHLRRSYTMFHDLGMTGDVSATPSTRYKSPSSKVPFLLREVYFTVHYWVTGQ